MRRLERLVTIGHLSICTGKIAWSNERDGWKRCRGAVSSVVGMLDVLTCVLIRI